MTEGGTTAGIARKGRCRLAGPVAALRRAGGWAGYGSEEFAASRADGTGRPGLPTFSLPTLE